jgi:orotidine-5'-phosphate decarboxylase
MGERRPFGERLVDAVADTGPLCAGIDPSAALLASWGLPDDAGGLARFGERCVEAFAGAVPVVKPQVAFFERHGSAGMAVLEQLIADAQAAGLLVIADAKRGDIDSTAAAYADAWLGADSPFAPDAMTVTPYLGLGALRPVTDAARANGRGVFVVVRSSNPEGRSIQEAVTAGGASVEDTLLAELAAQNRIERAGGASIGSCGAVVGATLAPSAFDLADLGGPILAPGVGAQGATAADFVALFAGCPAGTVLPNVSRSVLDAGPDASALRAAALVVRDEVASASV